MFLSWFLFLQGVDYCGEKETPQKFNQQNFPNAKKFQSSLYYKKECTCLDASWMQNADIIFKL